MSFQLRPLRLPGCFEISPRILRDDRGCFVKTFHREMFATQGLVTDFAEEYYSFSRKGVVRGFHFQLPPHDHTKMVYCLRGAVADVVLDLRVGSPTFGQHDMVHLSPDKASMVYIPPGIAHGFAALEDDTVMVYKVTSVYAPDHDTGVLWSSAGVAWPVIEPVVSARDEALTPLTKFTSPFRYMIETAG